MSEARSDRYLITKRGLYYRPNACGYTGVKAEAGRYPLAVAGQENCELGHVSFVHEDDAPDYTPACWEDVKLSHLEARAKAAEAEVERLRKVRDDLFVAGSETLTNAVEQTAEIERLRADLASAPPAQPLTDLSQVEMAAKDFLKALDYQGEDADGYVSHALNALRSSLKGAEKKEDFSSSQAQTISPSGLPQAEQEPVWSPWFPWSGGECPIPWALHGWHEVAFNDCHYSYNRALDWRWEEKPHYSRVTAFRYRLDRAPKGFVYSEESGT